MLGLYAARSFVRPLKKLTAATERIAEGDMTARADVDTRDEIGELAHIFNGMVPKLQEHSKMQDALRLAMEIQRNLLPQAPPKINGLDIAGLNVPADETGGDYYDFLDLTTWHGGTLAIAVGDVTGHGISAALLMATARAMLRSRATPPGELIDLISDVNVRLYDDTPDERFMTLMYMLVNRDLSYLRLVSAGHDPVIMYDPARGNFSEIEGDDIPLAVDREWKFTEKRYDLIPVGAILLIGTDGIWEARSASGEMFGKDRLNDLLKKHHHEPAAAIVRAVADALVAFSGRTRQKDDVTIVVIKFVEKT
jgi:sigma-B regulation protein RsbU (phosphoserine phosphatase)